MLFLSLLHYVRMNSRSRLKLLQRHLLNGRLLRELYSSYWIQAKPRMRMGLMELTEYSLQGVTMQKKNAALRRKTLRIISAIQTDRRKGWEVLDLYRRCFKWKVGIKIYVDKISCGEHRRRTFTMKIYAYQHSYAETKEESNEGKMVEKCWHRSVTIPSHLRLPVILHLAACQLHWQIE